MCGLQASGGRYHKAIILVIIMGKHFAIGILVLLLAHSNRAAAWGEVPVKLHAAQQVLVSGEDLWFDGTIGLQAKQVRIAHVQLLDRSGVVKAEAAVQSRDGFFQGYIEIPSGLPSDYYFLDATIKGFATEVALIPLMVVNPKYQRRAIGHSLLLCCQAYAQQQKWSSIIGFHWICKRCSHYSTTSSRWYCY